MRDLEQYRREKDNFLMNHPNSPLSEEQRRQFQGLNYYPENTALRFEVEVEPFEDQEIVELHTSTGDINQYIRYGRFQFVVKGETAELTVFSSEDEETFLPFVDATSPSETYGAGRYLEIQHIRDNRYLVDFNMAYNPWCAYSPFFSCPLPPEENRLNVPIEAGEMNFK